MDGQVEERGACATKAAAAACIVRATLIRVAPVAAKPAAVARKSRAA